jgi:hypothetical protein
VGISIAILIWNYFSKIRGWRQTELFGFDVIAGYASLTAIEFLFYLAVLWVRRYLLTFQKTIAQEVKDSLIEQTRDTAHKAPHLTPKRVDRIRAVLTNRTPFPDPITISVVPGYPDSYAFAQELKSAIESVSGWKARLLFTRGQASGVRVYFGESETAEQKELMFQLLTEAGIYFTTQEDSDFDADFAFILVGPHILLADER